MSNESEFSVEECLAGIETIPDGSYCATITKVEIEPIETGGDVVTLILEVEYKTITREVKKKYHVINDGVKEFLIKEMKKLGLEIASRKDFLGLREKLVGVKAYWKTLKNRDGFQCWYAVERVEGSEMQRERYSW